MKQLIWIFLFLSFQFFSFGQRSLFKGSNAIYPGNLIVNYVVCFQQPESDEIQDTIAKEDHFSSFQLQLSDLKYILTDSLLFGKTPVYKMDKEDAFFPYSILDNKIRLEKSEVGPLLNEKSIIESEDGKVSLIRKVISPEELQGFEFIEEWGWNPLEFSFTKKVIGYNPVLVFYNSNDKLRKKRTFYIIDTCFLCRRKNSMNVPILAAKVKYEYYIDKEYCDKANFQYADVSMPFVYNSCVWNKATETALIYSLCKPVFDNRIEVFDYNTNEKLTNKQAKERLGVRMDTVQVMDYEDNVMKTVFVQREFEPEKVKSVIFIEDWYLDKTTLMISKKVIGIAPVLFSDPETDSGKVKKTIPFVVYFKSN
jgi:hypothetical protein